MTQKLSAKQLLRLNEVLNARLQRAGDLCWHQRKELLAAGIISEKEFKLLDEMPMGSVRWRLDTYVMLNEQMKQQEVLINRVATTGVLDEASRAIATEKVLQVRCEQLTSTVAELRDALAKATAKKPRASRAKIQPVPGITQP